MNLVSGTQDRCSTVELYGNVMGSTPIGRTQNLFLSLFRFENASSLMLNLLA